LKPTILIADDDPVSQTVLGDLVTLCGYETVLADSGEQAWELLCQNAAIKVAFIDWLMPGMDGLALCSKIKRSSRDNYVYIIIISSKNQKEDVIKGLEAGADDFLAKPVHEGELLRRLRAGERVLDYEWRLKQEMRRADDLLANILPPTVASRLKAGEEFIADYFESASLLFIDIVGFTEWCRSSTPRAVMEQLNALFALYDDEIRKHGAEKIESVGDAYLVAAGIPKARPDHALVLARLALSIQARLASLNQYRLHSWSVRYGIATGSVVAGVIGRSRLSYDVFGDTVNRASRIEKAAPADQILVDDNTRRLIGHALRCEIHGDIEIKGLGLQRLWRLAGGPA
jgi:class 3 adenylate cyclase